MSIFSQRSRSSRKPFDYAQGRGFTLIELLVVMAIMMIVTSVLMVRQSKFNSSTLLRSLAYSVALSVRQAQVYGTSVYGTTTASVTCGTNNYRSQSGACFAQGYGIYVPSGSATSYILFADLNNNGRYDASEDVKVYSLGQGYSVSKICATTGAGVESCSPTIGWLGVLFRRPNPEACFTTSVSTGVCGPGDTAVYSKAYIQIQLTGAESGSTRSINLSSTGQISIGNSGS